MPADAPDRAAPSMAGHARTWLAMAGAICAAVIVRAAGTGDATLATVGAAGFVVAATCAAAVTARGWSRRDAGVLDEPRSDPAPARDGALLAAIAYAWGAVAMQAAYLTPLTGLRWQHGWQYALAMALLALGAILVARSTRKSDVAGGSSAGTGSLHRLARPLAAFQALIAGGGIAALAISGKAASVRADWAANRVFLGLAASILVVSLIYLAAGRGARHG